MIANTLNKKSIRPLALLRIDRLRYFYVLWTLKIASNGNIYKNL